MCSGSAPNTCFDDYTSVTSGAHASFVIVCSGNGYWKCQDITMKLLTVVILTVLLSAQTLAGHSGPKREAGKLLAVAKVFKTRCTAFGRVNNDALVSELERRGISAISPDEKTGVGAYQVEYLAEYDEAIRAKGLSFFCTAALEAFAEREPYILERRK